MTSELAIIGALLAVWLAVGALVRFEVWFLAATILFIVLTFALRVDAVTREILRREGRSRDRRDKKPFDH